MLGLVLSSWETGTQSQHQFPWNQTHFLKLCHIHFGLFHFAGSSLAPTNKKQCEKEKGYCGLLKCSFPYGIAGKCSRFYFCCKK